MQQSNTQEVIDTAPEATVLVLISTQIVGGPAKGLLQLLPALRSHTRMRTILCTFHKRGMPDSPFIRACREHDIPVTLLPQRHHFDPRPLAELKRIVAREHVDIVQTHGYKENIFGYLLTRATGKPWICFMHGTTDENLKVRLYHALDAHVVRRADRMVSVSAELARRMLPPKHAARAQVIDNAIATSPSTPSPLQVAQWRRDLGLNKAPVIACIGRLSPEKGQDVLLAAAKHLADAKVAFQLLLVGDGPSRAALQRQCANLGLSRQVHFLGQRNDVDMVYAASQVVALPSRKEGMPNVILEAMQRGRAIVATRVGAVPDMLRNEHEALLVPSGDVAALAAALQRMLQRPSQARAFGRAAKGALYPRFSLEQRTRNVEKLYREVLGGAR